MGLIAAWWVDVIGSHDEGRIGMVALQALILLSCILIMAFVQFFIGRVHTKSNPSLYTIVNCALWWNWVVASYLASLAPVMLSLSILFAAPTFLMWLEVLSQIRKSNKTSKL
jgi:hypothetical protein